MAPSRHDWKIVDWDVKPQHNQHNQKNKADPSVISAFSTYNILTVDRCIRYRFVE